MLFPAHCFRLCAVSRHDGRLGRLGMSHKRRRVFPRPPGRVPSSQSSRSKQIRPKDSRSAAKASGEGLVVKKGNIIPTPLSYFRKRGPQKSKLHLGWAPRGSKNVTSPPPAPSKRVKGGRGRSSKNVTCGTCLLTFYHPRVRRQIKGPGGSGE